MMKVKFLELIDENFILSPGENKKAKFLVKVRKEGTYKGRINVFFSPIDSKEPGVVLSSTIVVIAKKDQGYKETEKPETNNKNAEDNKSVNVFGGNPVSNSENKEGKISSLQKGLLSGISFILIVVIVGLSYFMIKKANRKKRRVKKSGGIRKRKKK